MNARGVLDTPRNMAYSFIRETNFVTSTHSKLSTSFLCFSEMAAMGEKHLEGVWEFWHWGFSFFYVLKKQATRSKPGMWLIHQKVWYILVLSSRTDFFVGSNFIPTATIVLTKQWSGNKCRDVLTKIQTSSLVMDHQDWPGKQWRGERQACRCTRLTAHFPQTVKPF